MTPVAWNDLSRAAQVEARQEVPPLTLPQLKTHLDKGNDGGPFKPMVSREVDKEHEEWQKQYSGSS